MRSARASDVCARELVVAVVSGPLQMYCVSAKGTGTSGTASGCARRPMGARWATPGLGLFRRMHFGRHVQLGTDPENLGL